MKKWGSFISAMLLVPVAWFCLYGVEMSYCTGLGGLAFGMFVAFVACLALSTWLFRVSFRTMAVGESGKSLIPKIMGIVWTLIAVGGLLGLRINQANEALNDAVNEISFQNTRHFDSPPELQLRKEGTEKIERHLNVASFWVSGSEKEAVRDALNQLKREIANSWDRINDRRY